MKATDGEMIVNTLSDFEFSQLFTKIFTAHNYGDIENKLCELHQCNAPWDNDNAFKYPVRVYYKGYRMSFDFKKMWNSDYEIDVHMVKSITTIQRIFKYGLCSPKNDILPIAKECIKYLKIKEIKDFLRQSENTNFDYYLQKAYGIMWINAEHNWDHRKWGIYSSLAISSTFNELGPGINHIVEVYFGSMAYQKDGNAIRPVTPG